MSTEEGSTKKFLYTGPESKARDEDGSQEWEFTNAKPKSVVRGPSVDLDDVWSIKKNVGVGNITPGNADKLTLNADTKFYSRHNGLKDKDASNQNKISSTFTNESSFRVPTDPGSTFNTQRRNSNTKRHSITSEDDFNF